MRRLNAGTRAMMPGVGLVVLVLEILIGATDATACKHLTNDADHGLLGRLFGPSSPILLTSIPCPDEITSSSFKERANSSSLLDFMSSSLDSVSQDMAQGGGEHLASLAVLMEVPADRRTAFFTFAQEQYAFLAQQGVASPAELIQSLRRTMAVHPGFSRPVALH